MYQEAKRRLCELTETQKRIEKALSQASPGKIHIVKSRKRIQFYLRKEPQDKSGKYIRKSEYKKLIHYLNKDYYEKILKYITFEKTNLESFLKNTHDIIPNIQQLYSGAHQQIKALLSPFDMSDEDYIKQWINIPFEGKGMEKEIYTYETEKGEHVRSKSELMIANMLYKFGIPYKYECPLKLKNGRIIHPDFTILDVANRKEKYWEHRGMMDDREYSRHTVKRIKDYAESGLYLGDDLIITEETQSLGLGTKEIQEMIRHYFL